MFISKKVLGIVLVMLAMLLLVGAAYASSGGEEIYACVKKGDIRIVASLEDCKANEDSLSWYQGADLWARLDKLSAKIEGVRVKLTAKIEEEENERVIADAQLGDRIDNIELLPGPQGETGPAGPPGTTSWTGLTDIPAGFSDGVDNGLTGWEVVVEDFELLGHDLRSVLVWCPSGKVVLGGGFDVPVSIEVIHSGPNHYYPNPRQWYIYAYNPTFDTETIHAYAVCAYGSQ